MASAASNVALGLNVSVQNTLDSQGVQQCRPPVIEARRAFFYSWLTPARGRAHDAAMELIIAVWVTCGMLGAMIGSAKQAAATGALVGFIFGPLGVIAAFAVDGRPRCPQCQVRIDGKPNECPQCGAALGEIVGVAFNCQRCGRELRADKVAGHGDFMTCPFCNELTGIKLQKPAPPKSITSNRLQPCPDCGHDVSRRAKACPQCGCPIAG